MLLSIAFSIAYFGILDAVAQLISMTKKFDFRFSSRVLSCEQEEIAVLGVSYVATVVAALGLLRTHKAQRLESSQKEILFLLMSVVARGFVVCRGRSARAK